jgi:GPN-loop GTPase
MVFFGQLVVGPPACGKTTYCNGVSQFMAQMGRPCAIVNLDFANEVSREGMYDCALDVRSLVSLERVMDEFELGPNGGIMYCMEYLAENIDWLIEKVSELEVNYIIFDCPGQVELFTHHTAMQTVVNALQKQLDFRLCSVHLLDSFYCVEPSTFISATLGVASTMLRLGLPHVNVLTKIDLLPMYGPLPFTLDFFTDMKDLSPLVSYIDSGPLSEEEWNRRLEEDTYDDDDDGEAYVPPPKKNMSKLAKMANELCSVLEDFGMLNYLPMNVQDATTVGRILIAIDQANGYSFAADEALEMRRRHEEGVKGPQSEEERMRRLFSVASTDLETTYERSIEIYEKYVDKFETNHIEKNGSGADVQTI